MSNIQQARARSNKVKLFTGALILVAAVFIGILINNATASSRFESEIAAINIAFASKDEKKVAEVLDRTVSSGNYAKVEMGLKQYVGDLIDNINSIDDVAGNGVVYDSLEASHLDKNKDNLDTTISELEEAARRVEVLAADTEKLYSETGAMEYVKDKGLNESYEKLFADNVKAFYDDENLRANYTNTLTLLKGSIKVEIEAVIFLKEHKTGWEIKDGKLHFLDDNLAKQYKDILESVAKK